MRSRTTTPTRSRSSWQIRSTRKERFRARQRADELIAKNRGDKIQAGIDNTHAAMQRIADLLETMNRETDEVLKAHKRRQDAREAEENWRQTHPPGRGPYSDAPLLDARASHPP